MFNYSKANLESLNNDLDSTLEECKKLVENIKSSTNVNLNDFNDFKCTVPPEGSLEGLGDEGSLWEKLSQQSTWTTEN